MSDTDSFIREVSEEVRRERFSQLLRRYGWIAALVVLALVAAAGFHEWQKARARAAAEAAGETLRAAYLVEAPAERAAAFAAAAPRVGAAAPVARIGEAGALLEAGDRAGAGEALASVSENAALLPVYRDLALLQRVAVLGPDMDRSERLAAIETLARPEGPFRALALEQRALARLEAGERDQARADLEAVLAEPGLAEGLAGRARQLLIAAGGTLPGEGAAEPAAAGSPPGAPGAGAPELSPGAGVPELGEPEPRAGAPELAPGADAPEPVPGAPEPAQGAGAPAQGAAPPPGADG